MYSAFRIAARSLLRWRGGFAVALVTLTLGIGTCTTLYALAGVLLASFPSVPEVDRVGRIYAASRTLGVERGPVALAELEPLAGAASFEAVGAYAAVDATIGMGPRARPVNAAYASPGFFSALGVPASMGRIYTTADLSTPSQGVVVSAALWSREFSSGDPVHATLMVDGVERRVIGVMPADFSYPFVGVTADLFLPLGAASGARPAIVTVFTRLRPQATWAGARAELEAISRGRGPWTWNAIPLEADAHARATGAYGITLGPAAVILLIACLNVACLLMARGMTRDRDLAIRRALGASRGQIARMLLGESLLLAWLSGAFGTALALASLRTIAKALSSVEPSLAAQIASRSGVPWTALAASSLACLAFGLLPALRLSGRDFLSSLEGRTAIVPAREGGYSARDLVVFGEVATAAGLMVWAAMVLTLFAQLRAVHFSFPADRIVAMRVPGRDARAAMQRVERVPGVSRAALASGMLGRGDRMRVETPGGRTAGLARVPVGEGFFEALDVPIVQGRSFNAADIDARSTAVILGETAAARLAPDGRAVGMRLRGNIPGAPEAIVIGVSRDTVDHGMLTQAGLIPAEIYVPFDPQTAEAVILARVETDARGSLERIGAAAGARPGERPPHPVVLSDELRGANRDRSAVLARLLGAFAVLTLLLAGSGVFAVIHQSVAQRSREFGIKMAIGASPRSVLAGVVAREARLSLAALGTGLAFSLGLTHALWVELTTLAAAVPGFSLTAIAAVLSAAVLATGLATRRIVRLDPGEVLRRS